MNNMIYVKHIINNILLYILDNEDSMKVIYKITQKNIIDDLYNLGLKLNELESDSFMKTICRDENGIYYKFIDGILLRDVISHIKYDEFKILYNKIYNILEYAYIITGFIHHDIHASNIIIMKNNIGIIDYDYSYMPDVFDNQYQKENTFHSSIRTFLHDVFDSVSNKYIKDFCLSEISNLS